MTDFFAVYTCDFDDKLAVVIEDDGRVAYAYLRANEIIVGDVWLYNQAKAPEDVVWKKDDTPFINPREFIDEAYTTLPVNDRSEIQVEWRLTESKNVKAYVFIRKVLVALLEPGAKPGWSRFVKRDGPLAKKYDYEELNNTCNS